MKSRLTPCPRIVGIHSDTGYPGQPVARKDERPGVAFLAWHASVDKDVLKLPFAATTQRAHRQTRPAKPKTDVMKIGFQVHRFQVVTADAPSHLKARARAALRKGAGIQ